MKSASLILIALAGLQAATLPPPEKEMPLYDGLAPGSEKWNWSERTISNANGMPIVQNVVPVMRSIS